MSYVEAVGLTMLGAGTTVLATLYFERYVTWAFNTLAGLITRRASNPRPKFNATLRKALVFYRRYGFWGLMALTPVLVGLPLGIWIAVRLGSSRSKVAVTTLLMSLLWSTLSFTLALNGAEQLGI